MRTISWARYYRDRCALDPSHPLPPVVYIDRDEILWRGRDKARVFCTRDEAEQYAEDLAAQS